jgi:hypothetical protein
MNGGPPPRASTISSTVAIPGSSRWARRAFFVALLFAGIAAAMNVRHAGSTWVIFGAFAVYVAAIALHARRLVPAITGAVAFALLGLSWWVDPDVHHAKLLPAAALGAWVAAWIVARAMRRDPVVAEIIAREAACGVVAAAYVGAGIAKLAASGLAWVTSSNLALLAAERAIIGPDWLRSIRLEVARTPWLCTALAAASLAIELAGVVFLLPRARRVYAIAAVLMHLGVAVLLGYVYAPWMVLIVALAWASVPPAIPRRPRTDLP